MGQNVNIANNTSQPIYVMVAPNPTWQLVDFLSDLALQAIPGLDVLADALEGVEAVEAIKDIVDVAKILRQASKVVEKAKEAREDIQDAADKANQILDAFQNAVKKIDPCDCQNVYSTDFLTYLNASGWAAMFDQDVDNLIPIITCGNNSIQFPTNDDLSWIVNDVPGTNICMSKYASETINICGVVRSAYGSLWNPDPGSGTYYFNIQPMSLDNSIVVAHQGLGNSGNLWINTFDGNNNWQGEHKLCLMDLDSFASQGTIDTLYMSNSPSLVKFNDLLYCFYQGGGNNGELHLNCYNGQTWLGDQQVPNTGMSNSPSAVVYNNQIYCFHVGKGGNGQLWYNVLDGNSWLGEQQVPNMGMSNSPSAVVYNNQIYCFHQGGGEDLQLWYNVFDGNGWQGDRQIPNTSLGSGGSPSAVVYNNQIYCFHPSGDGSGNLFYNVFDGNSWRGDLQVAYTVVSNGLSAVVYNNQIYCFHQGGGGDGQLFYKVFDGNNWQDDICVSGVGMSSRPSAILRS